MTSFTSLSSFTLSTSTPGAGIAPGEFVSGFWSDISSLSGSFSDIFESNNKPLWKVIILTDSFFYMLSQCRKKGIHTSISIETMWRLHLLCNIQVAQGLSLGEAWVFLLYYCWNEKKLKVIKIHKHFIFIPETQKYRYKYLLKK